MPFREKIREKQCPDCGKLFARHGRAVRCMPCQYEKTKQTQKERDATRSRWQEEKRRATQAPANLPSVRRYIMRPDFKLYLDEMKAELARQVAMVTPPGISVEHHNPLFLDNRRSLT